MVQRRAEVRRPHLPDLGRYGRLRRSAARGGEGDGDLRLAPLSRDARRCGAVHGGVSGTGADRIVVTGALPFGPEALAPAPAAATPGASSVCDAPNQHLGAARGDGE